MEGGYEAWVLGHAIFTQDETLEDVREVVRAAVTCHLEEERKPRIIRLHQMRDELLAV